MSRVLEMIRSRADQLPPQFERSWRVVLEEWTGARARGAGNMLQMVPA